MVETMNHKRRIVITGLGAVTPLGNSADKLYRALCRGESGISRITKFDPYGLATQIGGEVRGFDPLKYIDARSLRQLDDFTVYAVAASQMALTDAGLLVENAIKDRERFGVVIGSSIGGEATLEKAQATLDSKGYGYVSPFSIPGVLINLAAAEASIRYGAKGYIGSPSTACASGNMAIGEAAMVIAQGQAEVMIAGGSEAPVTPLTIASFNALRALSTANDNPQNASKPFDLERDGFVIGEGAGILVLEELDHALERNARIYAEIAGYACISDAYSRTSPPRNHEGAGRCMAAALRNAGMNPGDIDYLNAHGTSTPLNDKYETQAIKTIFKGSIPPLSSTKSMTGHLVGAAGGVEAVIATQIIQHGVIPPTINLKTPDPECDLDYVPNHARKASVKTVMSNTFGFGGVNSVLIIKKYEER